MEGENIEVVSKLYEIQEVHKKLHMVEIPEGVIYLIDTDGSGKRPVFVSKKANETIDFEGMVNKVVEAMKQILSQEFIEPIISDSIKEETPKTPAAKTKKEPKPPKPPKP